MRAQGGGGGAPRKPRRYGRGGDTGPYFEAGRVGRRVASHPRGVVRRSDTTDPIRPVARSPISPRLKLDTSQVRDRRAEKPGPAVGGFVLDPVNVARRVIALPLIVSSFNRNLRGPRMDQLRMRRNIFGRGRGSGSF